MSDRAARTVFIALLLSSSAVAEQLFDPMRPYSRAALPVVAGNKAPAGFALSAIVYSPDRRVAVINGEPVAEGQKIGGATVRSIERGKVQLDYRGKTVNLKLSTLRKSK
ncbi:MAG: general secretion pathway protein GspB [Gammaproteobacteria bacterium]|nr:general secretion pathway protein GspB [Gammaproteobacteria bacterium]NNF60009.1 GspB domain-containing protein [Gammaproteobacteria bacterium]NNM20087.1 GspB domain-containing protein [Gammaproteobacteria bacterium]